jgi:hypothetical protein
MYLFILLIGYCTAIATISWTVSKDSTYNSCKLVGDITFLTAATTNLIYEFAIFNGEALGTLKTD